MVEAGVLVGGIGGGMGEEAELGVFGRCVADQAGFSLSGADPDDGAEEGVVGEGEAEGVFVADAVLGQDEGGLVVSRGAVEARGNSGLVDGFVGADNVIKGLAGFGWMFVDFLLMSKISQEKEWRAVPLTISTKCLP